MPKEESMTTLSVPRADMTGTTQFTIGAEVSCRGGRCGKLTRVIIDPVRRALTHFVVESHLHGLGRLVPLELVDSATPEHIDLACTVFEFDHLHPSENTDYFPMDGYFGPHYGGYARGCGYGVGGASFWPHYGSGGLGYGQDGGPSR
jgi:hypothetical protein